MQIHTPVSQIMTRKPATVKPLDNLEVVRHIFEKNGFHHIPVVDNNQLTGMVSYTDYLKAIRELFDNPEEQHTNAKVLNAMLVKDVMTEYLVCLTPDNTVEDALEIFKNNQFHAIPIVGNHHQLAGIITTYDLIKVLERELAPQIDYASR